MLRHNKTNDASQVLKVADLKDLEGEAYENAVQEIATKLTPNDRRKWKEALIAAPSTIVQDWDEQGKKGYGQGILCEIPLGFFLLYTGIKSA